jgi:hypothetical protein
MAYEPVQQLSTGEKLYVVDQLALLLANYIKDFAPNNSLVNNDSTLISCPGPCAGHDHIFMEEEGAWECSNCNH